MGIREIKELSKMQDVANEHIEDVKTAIHENCEKIDSHLGMVQSEYHRVVELSGQAGLIVNQIDKDFKEKTQLDYKDTIILFMAVSLQCARQYLLSGEKWRLSASQGDQLMDSALSVMPADKKEVLLQSVPYDAISTGEHVNNTGLSGTTHRYRTLGHDPVLGWIFGTANIMTNSLTKYDFETFQVKDMTIIRHYPLGTLGMLNNATLYAQRDPMLLATAVARQSIHFGSDYFTKQGLPVPIISTVNNDLSKLLMTKGHMDMWNITRNAGIAHLINQLIVFMHRLFYDPDKDGSETTYEIRTRKILSYSNIIASGSNVLIATLTRDIGKLDLGGLLVTLGRIVSDYKFINKIKKDFLKNELTNKIVGSEYDFITEG